MPASPATETVQDRLRAARRHAGLTQGQLAARLTDALGHAVTQAQVAQWEQRVTGPANLEMVRAFAEALGVDPGWLSHGVASDATAPVWAAGPVRKALGSRGTKRLRHPRAPGDEREGRRGA